MEIQLGRFTGYVPEKNPVELVLAVLSRACADEPKTFSLKVSDVHSFFLSQKQKHPSLYEDVSFSADPQFPFSLEIEYAMKEIQTRGFISRPNPTYSNFQLKYKTEFTPEWASADDIAALSGAADDLKQLLL